MNFLATLDDYRSRPGQRPAFPELVAGFLASHPVYDQLFVRSWPLDRCPMREALGGPDAGVDVVLETKAGRFWAVHARSGVAGEAVGQGEVRAFLAATGAPFPDGAGGRASFEARLWLSGPEAWTPEAEDVARNRGDPFRAGPWPGLVPFLRLGPAELESAPVDWARLREGLTGPAARVPRKELLPHQEKALSRVMSHLARQGRGQLLMPGWTGKALVALRAAEGLLRGRGLAIFLAPSAALVGQALSEWASGARTPFQPICVCQAGEPPDLPGSGLPLPSSAQVPDIMGRLRDAARFWPGRPVAVFSSFGALDRLAEALRLAALEADLLVCGEAHLAGHGGPAWPGLARIHGNSFMRAKRRLYLSATPKIFGDRSKGRAQGHGVPVCSMDDERLFGPVIHRLGLGEAVGAGLASDYRVLVLAVSRAEIPDGVVDWLRGAGQATDLDEVARLVAVLHALSKDVALESGLLSSAEPGPISRCLAFCGSQEEARAAAAGLALIRQAWLSVLPPGAGAGLAAVRAEHCLGLDACPGSLDDVEGECLVLCQAGCPNGDQALPAPDAVILLAAPRSETEAIAAVAPAMRPAPGKGRGHVVIPVVLPPYVRPEEALGGSGKAFEPVWMVLDALRALDDRFGATMSKTRFDEVRPSCGGSLALGALPGSSWGTPDGQGIGALREAFFARLADRTGSRQNLLRLSRKAGALADGLVRDILALARKEGPGRDEFADFLENVRKTLNPAIAPAEAAELLAQHLVSRPVLEALFADGPGLRDDLAAQALDRMSGILRAPGQGRFSGALVAGEVAGLDDSRARRRALGAVYEDFLSKAFPRTAETLGPVFTPEEVVDFVNRSADRIMEREFGRRLADRDVHILDPFAGTGTFIARLMETGLVGRGEELAEKYRSGLHANETVLLAYYMAGLNIGTSFRALGGDAGEGPFPGLCLADTFRLVDEQAEFKEEFRGEEPSKIRREIFPWNSARVARQMALPVSVILGTPPFRVGQRSANANAQNIIYTKLHAEILLSYARRSRAEDRRSLYDSHVKAIRWATDRLDPRRGGLVAFVTDSGWLGGAAMDGLRKTLAEDFDRIYVLDLRGGGRDGGQGPGREGDGILGPGSRRSVAIVFLIRKPLSGRKVPRRAVIFYHGVGDFLSREEKLGLLASLGDVFAPGLEWETIEPSRDGDWINRRVPLFERLMAFGTRDRQEYRSVFSGNFSPGFQASRDAWCYNSSRRRLEENMRATIGFYNESLAKFEGLPFNERKKAHVPVDKARIGWSASLMRHFFIGRKAAFGGENIFVSVYRPFLKRHLYNDGMFNGGRNPMSGYFPTPGHGNLVICVGGRGGEFSALMVDAVPDCQLLPDCRCFPLYRYQEHMGGRKFLPGPWVLHDDRFARMETVTGFALEEFRAGYRPRPGRDGSITFAPAIRAEDVFFYAYGILHSGDYRRAFAADLAYGLPRLPLVDGADDFWAFSRAGRALADLHLNYETVAPFPGVRVTGLETGDLSVVRMAFAGEGDKSAVRLNPSVTISGIPPDAYGYALNGKPALEWVMDGYRATTDGETGLANDPDDWGREQARPGYALDLFRRLITVSLGTLEIVAGLPRIDFRFPV